MTTLEHLQTLAHERPRTIRELAEAAGCPVSYAHRLIAQHGPFRAIGRLPAARGPAPTLYYCDNPPAPSPSVAPFTAREGVTATLRSSPAPMTVTQIADALPGLSRASIHSAIATLHRFGHIGPVGYARTTGPRATLWQWAGAGAPLDARTVAQKVQEALELGAVARPAWRWTVTEVHDVLLQADGADAPSRCAVRLALQDLVRRGTIEAAGYYDNPRAPRPVPTYRAKPPATPT